MKKLAFVAAALGIAFSGSLALAAPADDFNAAYAKAEAAEKQAAQLKTSWTTTVDTLKDAKTAADAGKFDEAVALAREADALANASIAQAKSEQARWRDAVIR